MNTFAHPIAELWEITSLFGRVYNGYAKQFNLNENELACFYSLCKAGACTQKHICEEWLLSKQTVSALCKALMNKGYVEAVPHEGDQREKLLTLTDAGRAAAEPMIAPLLAAENAAIEAFGSERAAALVHEFRALQQLLAQSVQNEYQED